MYTNTVIAFSVIISIETLLVCVGNAFVIFVFWTQCTGNRRRASYLLINLAVTDFLIGVTKIPSFITNSIPPLMRKERSGLGDYIAAFVVLFSTASVVSLAAVSVERTAAVLWPLAHRTSGDRVYFYCIVFIWMTAMSVFVILYSTFLQRVALRICGYSTEHRSCTIHSYHLSYVHYYTRPFETFTPNI